MLLLSFLLLDRAGSLFGLTGRTVVVECFFCWIGQGPSSVRQGGLLLLDRVDVVEFSTNY